MPLITSSEIDALVHSWQERTQALDYKPGTKIYRKLEAEFFIGAACGLAAVGRDIPGAWPLLIASGRSLSATLCPEKAAAQPEAKPPPTKPTPFPFPVPTTQTVKAGRNHRPLSP